MPSERGSNITLWGVTDTLDNLKVFGDLLTDQAVESVANAVVMILSLSQRTVPHDTGELKASGTAFIRFGKGRGGYTKIVGRGSSGEESGVQANISGLRGRVSKVDYILGQVVYSRTNEEGENIALWTHEELKPYEERPNKKSANVISDSSRPFPSKPSKEKPGEGGPKYAKKPGRGPKYLENAYNAVKGDYLSNIREALSTGTLSREIRKRMQVKSRGKSYEVNITKLKRG